MSEKMSKEEANKLISQKMQEAKNLISECEKLADEHGLSFSTPVDEYGMGGTFYGKGQADENGEWENSSESGWVSSSASC